jgi:hypothetical protein
MAGERGSLVIGVSIPQSTRKCMVVSWLLVSESKIDASFRFVLLAQFMYYIPLVPNHLFTSNKIIDSFICL